MKRLNFSLTALMGLLFILASCSSVEHSQSNRLLGNWVITKIVYDDKSEKILGEGNYVYIFDDYLVEEAAGYGKRRYPYRQENNQLILSSGGEEVSWNVLVQAPSHLEIQTPIGLYVLDSFIDQRSK